MPFTLEDIKILYEDRSMIVVVKPSGLPSQMDKTGNIDLLTLLNNKYGNAFLIHRLDTATGGVMVYARGKRAAGILSGQIQDHEIFKKTYLAVLDKTPTEVKGELVDYLYHDKRQNKSFVVKNTKSGAKLARLSYEMLATNNDGNCLVKVRLHTGRSHQIRVQFASRGLPIYGDGKYGSRCKMKGFALWSTSVVVRHPITNEEIKCDADPNYNEIPWNLFAVQ